MPNLLDEINDEINNRRPGDRVRAVMIRVKEEAYRLQVAERLDREDALEKALRTVTSSGGSPAVEYVQDKYAPTVVMLTEDQVRSLLPTVAHLSDKLKVKEIVRRYQGRVDPGLVKRVVKGR